MIADWTPIRLSDVAKVRVSNVDKKTNPGERPVRLCNYLDVYTNDYITDRLEFMEASVTPSEFDRFALKRGDVIITKDSETPDDIGVAAIVSEDIEQLVCGYHLALIRPNQEEVDPVYLAKQLATHPVARYFGVHATGSTRYGLPTAAIENLLIPKAARPEQEKIAEILVGIDKAIALNEQFIAKHHRIKTGLAYDLLTGGIDEHGHIRSAQTHQFHDTPLGPLPVGWDVKSIGELLADVDPAMRSGPFGSALRKDELTDSGVPLLGIDNVFPERFVAAYTRFVPPKKADLLKRYRVRPGDIMVTIMGTVGRCCVVPDDVGTALSSKHTWTISLDTKKYSPYLACLQINYAPWVLRHFRRDEQGGIMSAIKSDTLRSTLLPVPPLPEMELIEQRMKAHARKIEFETQELSKLRLLKVGLMQDLLSGSRRVTPLLAVKSELAVQA
jgi:type I restriction enzyme S subunit